MIELFVKLEIVQHVVSMLQLTESKNACGDKKAMV